jgi:hypothetical protein
MCHGRRLLDLVAVRLRAALLMDKAAADIACGDVRNAVVAERFIVRRLQPPVRRALASIGDPAQHHFDAIIGYRNLPITALRGQLPAM